MYIIDKTGALQLECRISQVLFFLREQLLHDDEALSQKTLPYLVVVGPLRAMFSMIYISTTQKATERHTTEQS